MKYCALLRFCMGFLLISNGIAQYPHTNVTPTVSFFQVYVLAAYEGLEESNFPGFEDEPTILVSQERRNKADEVAEWLRELFRFESVDVLDVQTVVEVHCEGVHEAQPTFFQVGNSSEFRIWWLGGLSALLPNLVTISLSVDLEQANFIPQLQVILYPMTQVVVGKRCTVPAEDGVLESFADFSYQPDQIFLLAITSLVKQVASKDDYRPVVDYYMELRGQQKARAGTIPLVEDQGYILVENLFEQSFGRTDFGYAKSKRLPISWKPSSVVVTTYEVPPQPVKGTEGIRKALTRILEPGDMKHLKMARVNILINEKGRVEDMAVSGSIDDRLQKDLLTALKLVRWKPATNGGKPVKVWTVLALPDVLK